VKNKKFFPESPIFKLNFIYAADKKIILTKEGVNSINNDFPLLGK